MLELSALESPLEVELAEVESIVALGCPCPVHVEEGRTPEIDLAWVINYEVDYFLLNTTATGHLFLVDLLIYYIY